MCNLIDLQQQAEEYLAQDRYSEAIVLYEQCIEAEPTVVSNYWKLGLALLLEAKELEAQSVWLSAIAAGTSEEIEIWTEELIKTLETEAISHLQLGNLHQSEILFCQILELNSDNINALVNLGFIVEEQGKLEKAISFYQQAIELEPDHVLANWNRVLAMLRSGNLACGFAEFEWRWRVIGVVRPFFFQCFWDGSSLDGKTILIHAEGGFGDAIQFARYIPLVAQQHECHIIFECREPLKRLMESASGINQLIVEGEELPHFDVHAPLMSLPRILETTLENISAEVPYISFTTSSIKLETPPEKTMKVGIVWAGEPANPQNHKRSCSLIHFSELLNLPGISFYSLQKGSRVKDLDQLPYEELLQDLSHQIVDFADTAALVAQLDLVITVDTAVAHLAGALGQPVWVLLSFVPDWRWMMDREDSPWYPTMRLFRQKEPGDWAGVFERVGEALQQLVSHFK
ncbi:MAG: glycosyltransferase family protein [Chroococcidiopsidaceae cyanobacterium CP_BM_RX_35]|nr:glycosyltransferase family protein [Chroococcidiopsidaceae cyanobacterium CP_BM_RX_35]